MFFIGSGSIEITGLSCHGPSYGQEMGLFEFPKCLMHSWRMGHIWSLVQVIVPINCGKNVAVWRLDVAVCLVCHKPESCQLCFFTSALVQTGRYVQFLVRRNWWEQMWQSVFLICSCARVHNPKSRTC